MGEKLTPQQKLAVENRGGKLLVSAAAGSGKTKVLVDRLMSYLTDPVAPANIDDFLIITYTKAAASELRGKISDKLTQYIAEHPENRHMQQQIQRLYLAKISTVHAFCSEILREYAYRLDIPADFRIAEESECQEMMQQVLKQLLDGAYEQIHTNDGFRYFVDTQGLGRDDRQIPEIVLQVYSSALCHLDPDAWLDWCKDSASASDAEDAANTIWGAYLISDFMHYLEMQMHSIEHCIRRIQDVPGMEKPTALLQSTLSQLEALAACKTWDTLVSFPAIEYGTLSFTKEHRGTELAEQVKAIRNACKEGLTKKLRAFSDTSTAVISQQQESALAISGLVELVKAFRAEYTRIKNIRRVLDFSDIEQYTLDLLLGRKRSGFTAAAEEIGSRFREIMVDEYQDSNQVQDAIFSILTAKHQNCFMVGDVKQSIYQFRLADPGIFLEKYNDYLSADIAQSGEGRKVLLSSNFRSSNGVISAVNDVFSECMTPKVGGLYYSESEKLYEGIPHISLPDREVELYGIDVKADTYQEEAAFTARRIQTLLDGHHMVRDGDTLRPVTEDDIVILLRSPGSVGGEFLYALSQAGISCTMGSDTDLLLTPEVETLRSILQIIHNPLQDIPLIAALSSPVFGFTADELANIRSQNRYTSFYDAIAKAESEKAQSFLSLLTALRKDARFLTVSQLIHQIFLHTGMLSIYGAAETGEVCVQHLHDFCQIASDFESTGRRDLSYFLEYLAALDESGLTVGECAHSGCVRIMSIHKSKGLEFPVVFLCGLSRGFNTTDATRQVLCHKDLGIGLGYTNANQRIRFPTIAKRAISAKIRSESVSEELRVLYVAMTRARDRLIMTYAVKKLADQLNEIALRLDMSDRELLTANVTCPGDWVLLSALQRTEAGEFFNISTKPNCSRVRDIPWSIEIADADTPLTCVDACEAETEAIPDSVVWKLQDGLSFRYRYTNAVSVPSKITATQMKGRVKDQEAAEFTGKMQKTEISFRTPGRDKRTLIGTEYGNAMHRIMQYLRFRCCTDLTGIQKDICRMEATGLITPQEAAAADAESIYRFFQTNIGHQLINCQEVLREFKFSILEDASAYYKSVMEDQILLQGVIDCAMVEADGLTILDFKTDYISSENLKQKTNLYTPQIQTYAKALSKIYRKPIKAAFIYFFSGDMLIEIN